MPLHDILPPIEISNAIFFYLAGGLFGLFTLLFGYLYKIQKKPLSSFQILERCNFNDAKKTALQFSYYGKKIFKNEVIKGKFLLLEERLNVYKYIKNRTILPQELVESIKELLEEARENHA